MAAVGQRSKSLFNNVHMLRIAAEIGQGPEKFSSVSLQDALGLGQSTVRRTVRALEDAGLVERTVRSAQTNPLEYSRTPHSFWSAVVDLCEAEGNAR